MALTKRADTRFSRGDRVLPGTERVGNKIPEAFILLCGLVGAPPGCCPR
jgi:hypothetical protein